MRLCLRELDVPALHSPGGLGSVGYYLSITCLLPARGAPASTERMQVTECASGISGCGVEFYLNSLQGLDQSFPFMVSQGNDQVNFFN